MVAPGGVTQEAPFSRDPKGMQQLPFGSRLNGPFSQRQSLFGCNSSARDPRRARKRTFCSRVRSSM